MTMLLIFLTLLCPSKMESDFMTEVSKSVDALVALLNLTDLTCDSIEWCTVRKNPEKYIYTSSVCCPPCSCETQCFEDGNCCPDIKLSHHLNGTVLLNISQLMTRIKEIDHISELDIAYRNGVRSQSKVGLECHSSALYQYSRYSIKAPMYLMIATCQNKSVSTDDSEKCEKRQDLTDELKLGDIRPVQSRQSGFVYRNVYCFECSNESGSITEMWDVYLVDRPMAFDRILKVDELYPDIVSYVFQQPGTALVEENINILFEPSRQLRQNHPSSACVDLDVETCGEDLTDIQNSTRHACQSFTLPIYSMHNNYNATFQNLACVHCNGIDAESIKGICNDYVRWSASSFPWKLQNELLQDVETNSSERASGYAETTINAFLSSRCQNGFVYDSVQKLCRQIYCPCGMIAYNSTCIQTFTAIPGKYYAIFFSVITTSWVETEQADLQYDEAIMAFFKYHFDTKEDVGLVDIGLLKPDNKGTNRDDVVQVLLDVQTKYFNFNYLLKNISKLTKEMQAISIDNLNVLVDISVLDTVPIKRSTAVSVPKMQKNYKLVNATTWAINDILDSNIKAIHRCQFCYLIEMLNDEFEVKGRMYYISRTETFGTSRSISTITSTGQLLVCANDVIEPVQVSKVAKPPENGCCSSLPEDTEDDIQRSPQTAVMDIVIVASLVAIVLFISLIVVRTKTRRTEASSGVNTNNAQALEMSNMNQE